MVKKSRQKAISKKSEGKKKRNANPLNIPFSLFSSRAEKAPFTTKKSRKKSVQKKVEEVEEEEDNSKQFNFPFKLSSSEIIPFNNKKKSRMKMLFEKAAELRKSRKRSRQQQQRQAEAEAEEEERQEESAFKRSRKNRNFMESSSCLSTMDDYAPCGLVHFDPMLHVLAVAGGAAPAPPAHAPAPTLAQANTAINDYRSTLIPRGTEVSYNETTQLINNAGYGTYALFVNALRAAAPAAGFTMGDLVTAIGAADLLANGYVPQADRDRDVAAAETARLAAVTAEGLAVAARLAAEAARADAEAARLAAVTARADAEAARDLAVADRDRDVAAAVDAQRLAETARADAETARADAEAAQDLAEAAQDLAEAAQGDAEAARLAAVAERDRDVAAAEAARRAAVTARYLALADRDAAVDAQGRAERNYNLVKDRNDKLEIEMNELQNEIDNLKILNDTYKAELARLGGAAPAVTVIDGTRTRQVNNDGTRREEREEERLALEAAIAKNNEDSEKTLATIAEAKQEIIRKAAAEEERERVAVAEAERLERE